MGPETLSIDLAPSIHSVDTAASTNPVRECALGGERTCRLRHEPQRSVGPDATSVKLIPMNRGFTNKLGYGGHRFVCPPLSPLRLTYILLKKFNVPALGVFCIAKEGL